jgi:hypothetical protein
MTDAQKTAITMVLDRSGSMRSYRETTVRAVNKYLGDARNEEKLKDADLALMIFDSQSIDVIRSGRLGDQKDLANEEFEPRQSTPLLDAIGRGISSLDNSAGDGKAILVIVTDGLENASRKHTYESIKALLDDRQEKGWLVVFLGAGLEAARQGERIGVNFNNTASIALDEASLAATSSMMFALTGSYASTRSREDAKAYAASPKISRSVRRDMGDPSGGDDLLRQKPKPSHAKSMKLADIPNQSLPVAPATAIQHDDAWTSGAGGDVWGG